MSEPSPSSASAPITFPVVSPVYKITRLIGQGGMGEVYEAVHERTGAPLAIKILLTDISAKPDLLARFKREAEITSKLRHPNIVKVFDFDQMPDGRPFIAMEMLSGRPLDQLMHPGRPLPLAQIASIVDQVALGLAAAHAASVVHRDLKPANLFIEPMAGSEREHVRILDFGISKIRDASSNLTQTMAIIGTPGYMSPEQAMGRTREIDGRSDQFSFASIVFELLSGRSAFGSDDPTAEDPPAAVLYRVVHEHPVSLESLGVKIPTASQDALMRALSKDPAARFESVAAFSRAFLRPLGPLLTADPLRATTGFPAERSAAPSPPPPSPSSSENMRATRILPTGETAVAASTVTEVHFPAKGRRGLVVAAGVGALVIVALAVLLTRGTKTDQAAHREVAPLVAPAKVMKAEPPPTPVIPPPQAAASPPPTPTPPPTAAKPAAEPTPPDAPQTTSRRKPKQAGPAKDRNEDIF